MLSKMRGTSRSGVRTGVRGAPGDAVGGARKTFNKKEATQSQDVSHGQSKEDVALANRHSSLRPEQLCRFHHRQRFHQVS
jgi:hypothetical protein